MYQGDSFYTLSTAGQAGLVVLSLALTAAAFWLLGKLLKLWRWHETLGRYSGAVATAFAVFWLFVWLSPQIYYTYYLILIDSLPWQIVIGHLPGPIRIFKFMTFTGSDTLSAHTQGALGWILLGHAVTTTYRRGGH